jgi:hypothetical protein
VVLNPRDLLVSTIPVESGDGDAWIILQNKGQVDVPHPTRDGALARAREAAQALRSRVFVMEGDRIVEDQP